MSWEDLLGTPKTEPSPPQTEEKPKESKPQEPALQEPKPQEPSVEQILSPQVAPEPTGQGRAKTVVELEKGPPEEIKPEETAKEVFMLYGEKGEGKTYAALSFPGTILALSFDYKTAIVKKSSFNNDSRITVYDALIKEEYTTPEAELASSKVTLAYINEVLDRAKANPPDWVLIDGSEIFQRVAENLMRYNNNLGAFAGVQWTFWKERRFYIRQLHEKAIRLAKRGVIYTSYVDKDEIVVDGTLKSRTDCPKWVDAVLHSVDSVIRVFPRNDTNNGRRYIARVDSTKLKPQTSGKEFDITNVGVKNLI